MHAKGRGKDAVLGLFRLDGRGGGRGRGVAVPDGVGNHSAMSARSRGWGRGRYLLGACLSLASLGLVWFTRQFWEPGRSSAERAGILSLPMNAVMLALTALAARFGWQAVSTPLAGRGGPGPWPVRSVRCAPGSWTRR